MSAGRTRPPHSEAPVDPVLAPPAETPVSTFTPLLSDEEIAEILIMTVEWVRAHSTEIPGFKRLGIYYRFHRNPIEQWLGSLDRPWRLIKFPRF